MTPKYWHGPLEHYRLVGPLIEASFAGTPIVFANYPKGLDQPAYYHVTAVQLSIDKILWLVATPGVEFERVKLAALALRALLFDVAKLEAIPLS